MRRRLHQQCLVVELLELPKWPLPARRFRGGLLCVQHGHLHAELEQCYMPHLSWGRLPRVDWPERVHHVPRSKRLRQTCVDGDLF